MKISLILISLFFGIAFAKEVKIKLEQKLYRDIGNYMLTQMDERLWLAVQKYNDKENTPEKFIAGLKDSKLRKFFQNKFKEVKSFIPAKFKDGKAILSKGQNTIILTSIGLEKNEFKINGKTVTLKDYSSWKEFFDKLKVSRKISWLFNIVDFFLEKNFVKLAHASPITSISEVDLIFSALKLKDVYFELGFIERLRVPWFSELTSEEKRENNTSVMSAYLEERLKSCNDIVEGASFYTMSGDNEVTTLIEDIHDMNNKYQKKDNMEDNQKRLKSYLGLDLSDFESGSVFSGGFCVRLASKMYPTYDYYAKQYKSLEKAAIVELKKAGVNMEMNLMVDSLLSRDHGNKSKINQETFEEQVAQLKSFPNRDELVDKFCNSLNNLKRCMEAVIDMKAVISTNRSIYNEDKDLRIKAIRTQYRSNNLSKSE